jgi:hypothetical protein
MGLLVPQLRKQQAPKPNAPHKNGFQVSWRTDFGISPLFVRISRAEGIFDKILSKVLQLLH